MMGRLGCLVNLELPALVELDVTCGIGFGV